MVKAIIDISDRTNQILNIIKAKENLRDKSQAIDVVVSIYSKELLEPELRPEFVKKLIKQQAEKTIKVKNFSEHYK